MCLLVTIQTVKRVRCSETIVFFSCVHVCECVFIPDLITSNGCVRLNKPTFRRISLPLFLVFVHFHFSVYYNLRNAASAGVCSVCILFAQSKLLQRHALLWL